ncbi:hypothetical protein BGZ74_009984 [Mortierella antarctica]|nr:hypothetical protein BGZ74_009984 [Mortierella antarctica]
MLNPSQTEQGVHQTKPTKHSEQQPKHVPSSMEDEFWEGTECDDRPIVERGQHSVSQGPVTSPRRSIRRHNSTINDLRLYKADDAVWARWKKRDYYAGVVTEKKAEKYRIFFLDNDHGDCEAGEMRPLKLKLGAEVLAQKTEAYYPAIVEGMHMSSILDQSRVDVRFTQDDVEGNFPLSKICLTTEMMDALDTALAMDVDQELPSSLPASLPQTRQLRGPSREASSSTLTRKTASPSVSPQKTPSKGKGRAVPLPQRTLSSLSSVSGASSPSRRDKVTFQNVGLMTPSRRSKEREVTAKIKAGGGEVLESFAALDQHRRTNSQVLLISFSYLRTPKYMEALALNVPRLSYRWIDACTEDRTIVPQSSYLLPSGMSKELGTVVSAVPAHDRGIFENVTIGICGTRAFRDHWERTLIGAGAKVEIVSGKTGTRGCAYIVFQNLKAHEKYSQGQSPLPKLSAEWLVQCLINQRIVSINGHPVYTELSQ